MPEPRPYVDAEALVSALADLMLNELVALRERLAEAEAELARLRREVDADQ